MGISRVFWVHETESGILVVEYGSWFQSLVVFGKNDFWWQLVLGNSIWSKRGFRFLVVDADKPLLLNSRAEIID